MRTLCFLLSLWVALPACQPDVERLIADLCILGGSEAAFTAALQAARRGHSVILVEPTGHPGGMMVEGIVKDIRFGSAVVIGGITREVYTAIEAEYGQTPDFADPNWSSRYEPSIAEAVIERLLAAEPNIQLIRHTRIREQGGVEKQGSLIRAIRLENGQSVQARLFLDASIEGDLLHLAGVTTETIREGNARYGETKNGIQHENTYRNFTVDVDPYVIPGDPSSGLIATIQPGELGEFGAPDKHIQGFCFRICLTRDSANRLDITQPAGYDPATYEIYRRYLAAGGRLFAPYVNRAHGKTDLGSWHDLSANLYGENWAYPAGSYRVRDSLVQYHRNFTQGLTWFLQHDPAVDSLTRSEWAGWGLCRDEFTDNGGWPRRLYIRSARRMVSGYVITEHHTRRDNPERVADPVTLAWWPPDTHHARRIVQGGKAYNEGFVFGGDGWRPFGISWRALLPRPEEASNLLTPTCPSSSYVAYGAIRILPTFMMLGQATGLAASLALERGEALHALPYAALRSELEGAGMVLKFPADWRERVAGE